MDWNSQRAPTTTDDNVAPIRSDQSIQVSLLLDNEIRVQLSQFRANNGHNLQCWWQINQDQHCRFGSEGKGTVCLNMQHSETNYTGEVRQD